MLMLIGFGLFISAYYIYNNKNNVMMNIAKAGIKIEDIYLNYKGLSISYLVPNHDICSLTDQYNKYYLDRYISNLSHNTNYDKTNNDYFVILKYCVKRKTYCYVKNSFTFADFNLTEEDLNFSSSIILCNATIYEETKEGDKKELFSNLDVTKCFNYLINRNTKIVLSNTLKYKQFWIYYLNYFLEDRNIFINSKNIENIKITWNIMDSNIKTIEGSEILITTNNTNTNISIITDEEKENLSFEENEYDSIEDLNEIDFSSKINFNSEFIKMNDFNEDLDNSNSNEDLDNSNSNEEVNDSNPNEDLDNSNSNEEADDSNSNEEVNTSIKIFVSDEEVENSNEVVSQSIEKVVSNVVENIIDSITNTIDEYKKENNIIQMQNLTM